MSRIRLHAPSRPDAELLRRLRKHLNLTQIDLSNRSGVAASVIAKLESGTLTNPVLSTLNSVAKVLNINTAQLLITDEPCPHNYALVEQLKTTGVVE